MILHRGMEKSKLRCVCKLQKESKCEAVRLYITEGKCIYTSD